jgi:hypothetical protein
MAQIGNKINSWLNGEWAKHGRPYGKKLAAHRRRIISKLIIRKERDNSEQLAATKEPARREIQ